jgi:hypothetical protein
MRPLVEPPPSLRCTCGGELRLKLIETAGTFRKQREILVCTDCSRERTFLAVCVTHIWASIASVMATLVELLASESRRFTIATG